MNHSADPSAPLILIVEDDALIAMEIESQVQTLGYAVLGSAPVLIQLTNFSPIPTRKPLYST